MSNLNDILKKVINGELDKNRFYSEVGQVVSVDEDNMLCEVSFLSSNANKEVRLGSVISEDDTAKNSSSLIILPAVDSFVMVTFINQTTGFISLFSEVDKILYQIGNSYIQLDDSFLELMGNSDNAVRYSPLDTELQLFKDAIQGELTKIQTAITGLGGVYVPGTLSLDISGAKIDEIKTI